MEILPGIHHLQVPIFDTFLNAYLFKSDEGSLLIDTGWNADDALGALVRQLGEAGVALGDITYIGITHAHPDHYGLAGRLAQHCEAKLVIHEKEHSFLGRRVSNESLMADLDRWFLINGVPEAAIPDFRIASEPLLDLVQAGMPIVAVQGGEHLELGDFDFEIIWTPGHSPGHICFYERKRRLLISGDHVLRDITPTVGMDSPSGRDPLTDFLASLSTVKALAVQMVLPSHGEPFRDLPERIAQLCEHTEQRRQHIVTAVDGGKTAYQVASEIPWNTNGVSWRDLPPLHKRIAVLEALAHLERLRAEGVIRKTIKEDIVQYGV